jgi:hypothetical protein
MIYDRDAVEAIEHSRDDQPYCPCGKHTMPVWRDGAIWLECASLSEPTHGRLGRLWTAFASYTHTRVHLLDAPLLDEAGEQQTA